jgi:ABC-2 type transport system permease protein
VRSTLWSLFAFVVVAIGFSVLVSAVISHDWNTPGNHPNHLRLLTDPTEVIYGTGFGLGQLALCVLGVMVITTEYSTGAIRASLLAVPKRIPMLAAKGPDPVSVNWARSALAALAEPSQGPASASQSKLFLRPSRT